MASIIKDIYVLRWERDQGCFRGFLYLGDPEFLILGQLSGK